MKSGEFVEVTLAMVGLCCWLGPATPHAQSAQTADAQVGQPARVPITPTASVRIETSAKSAQSAPGPSGATSVSARRMFSQPIPREVMGPAFAPSRQQTAPAPRKSWVARHKVLTAVLIGATPFVVWGAMIWNTCSGGGC